MRAKTCHGGVWMILIAFAIAMFASDAFGQRFFQRQQQRQQQNNQNGAAKKQYSFKMVLEYSTGSAESWKAEKGSDLPLISKEPVNEKGQMVAGGPTIDTYTLNKNKPITFYYTNDITKAKTKFVVDNAAKTVTLKHNFNSTDEWKLAECDGITVDKKVLKAARPNTPGDETEEQWTFGDFEAGKDKATAIFTYSYHGDEATKVEIQISK